MSEALLSQPRLITLEGGEGAGKTSAIAAIRDRLQAAGHDVVLTREREYSSGTPLTDNRTWRKNAARFKQLDALARRVLAADKET